MTHHQVRRDEIPGSHALALDVDRGLDQRHARQRRRVGEIDQRGSLNHVLDIDVDRIGNPFRIRPHDDHFAREKHERIAELSVARQPQASFQDEHLDVTPRDIFHHDGRARNGGRDCGSVNFGTAQTLGHLEKHRSLFQGHVARSRFEAEERLRAEPREGVVLKKQFRTRFLRRLHAEIVLDDVPDQGRAFARGGVDDRDAINDLSDFREGQRTGDGGLEGEKRENNGTRPNRGSEHRRLATFP
jgi:hypothetical protein